MGQRVKDFLCAETDRSRLFSATDLFRIDPGGCASIKIFLFGRNRCKEPDQPSSCVPDFRRLLKRLEFFVKFFVSDDLDHRINLRKLL